VVVKDIVGIGRASQDLAVGIVISGVDRHQGNVAT
jgi:hypothetical protein